MPTFLDNNLRRIQGTKLFFWLLIRLRNFFTIVCGDNFDWFLLLRVFQWSCCIIEVVSRWWQYPPILLLITFTMFDPMPFCLTELRFLLLGIEPGWLWWRLTFKDCLWPLDYLISYPKETFLGMPDVLCYNTSQLCLVKCHRPLVVS